MVRIRMSRMGRTHRPFYRINAVEKRTQRDGKVLENLGWYNPMEQDADKQLSLKAERISHWISVGAQPSDTCNDLFAKAGLIDADAWKAVRTKRVQKNMDAAVEKKKAEEEAARLEAEQKAKEEAEAKAAAEAEAKAKAEEEAAAAKEAESSDEAPAEDASEAEKTEEG